MSEPTYWDIPCLTWGQLIDSTAIDPRQLRNALDRGMLKSGKKRSRQLMFSLRERFGVDLVSALTSNWIPISIAAEVANRVQRNVEIVQNYWNEVYLVSCLEKKPDLWLMLTKVSEPQGGDGIAIGFRAEHPSWPSEGLPFGVFTEDLPTYFSVSLMHLFKRNVEFCLAHMGDDAESAE